MEPAEKPQEQPRSWWGGAAGLLTAAGAVITAIAGLLAGLHQLGVVAAPEAPGSPSPVALGAEHDEAPPPPETRPMREGPPLDGPRALVGTWTWEGQDCAAGPRVTYEGNRLVFVTPSTRFVHRTLSSDGHGLRTSVVSPSAHAGEIYRFELNGNSLRLFEEATRQEHLWIRCTDR